MSAIPPLHDPLGQPLVVRNKRGRKVDETLPKSHQREVQRLFRARRSTHLSDLERRVSLLERENVILRQWAGVKPSDRYLLGRGPTGCDTTKPLIADENDLEIQLEIDDTLPHERTWPRTPPALPPRTSFVLDHQPSQQQPPTPRSEVPGSTSMATGMINHNIHPNVLQASAGGGVSYDKPQANYQMTNAQKYKPHPLYDHLEPLPPPPPPVSYEPPPPSSSYGPDRLIKRESVYPASGGSMVGSSQDLSSAQPHSAPYYSIPHRPSYARPMDAYTTQPITAIPADSPTSHLPLYAQSSWPDSYAARPPTTPVPRRPQVTATLASIVPPVGLSSGPVSSNSPQSNSGSEPRSNVISPDGAYDQRRSSIYSAYPPPSATPAPMPPTSVYIPHSQPPSQSQTTPTSAVSLYALDNSSHRDLSAPQPPPPSDSFR